MPGGVRCSVGICKSQYGKMQDGRNISFFTFPKNPDLRKRWIHKCYRSDLINPNTARICSLHFKPTDFKRNLKAELLNIPCKKALNTSAVPSLMLKPEESHIGDFSRDVRTQKVLIQDLVIITEDQMLPPTTGTYEESEDYEALLKKCIKLEDENKQLREKLKSEEINNLNNTKKIAELEQIIQNQIYVKNEEYSDWTY